MTAPCPTPPAYYDPILHTVAIVSAPINVLGLYLVLYKSPGISKYKYCAFYVQLAAFLTELQMSVVAPGYYFFPMLAGYITNKYVPYFFKDTHIVMTTYLFFLSSELPAVVSCFIYRHNAAEDMNRDHRTSRFVKKCVFTICQTFPFATAYCFYISRITKDQVHTYLSQNYPQCLFWMQDATFQLYDYHLNYWIAVTGVGAVVIVVPSASYAFSLGFRTMALLHKLRAHMSAQTYRMHRSALIALTLQVILPSVLLILPVLICFWVVATDQLEHQELATNSTMLISGHSLCSSLVMIVANPRYRAIVGEYFGKMCRLKPPTKNVAVEPSSGNFKRGIS